MQLVVTTDKTHTCEVKLHAVYTSESRIFSAEVNINVLSVVVFDDCKCVATAEGCLRLFTRNRAGLFSEKEKNSYTEIPQLAAVHFPLCLFTSP